MKILMGKPPSDVTRRAPYSGATTKSIILLFLLHNIYMYRWLYDALQILRQHAYCYKHWEKKEDLLQNGYLKYFPICVAKKHISDKIDRSFFFYYNSNDYCKCLNPFEIPYLLFLLYSTCIICILYIYSNAYAHAHISQQRKADVAMCYTYAILS